MKFSIINQARTELQSILYGYPNYVYSGRVPAQIGNIPVFIYHSIEQKNFEHDLRYLSANGYTTIGLSELVPHLRGQTPVPDKAVILTFDDARSSFWRFGYPLLQRYQMRGVLFVIAGLTEDTESVRENLFSVWEGESSAEEIEAIDPKDETLCTWSEIRAMYASGWVEVESHSLFHQEVFVDTELVGFLGPETSYVPFQTPATAYLSANDVGAGIVPEKYFGLPLFRSAPLHSGQQAWDVPAGLRRRMKELWERVPAGVQQKGRWQRWLRSHWTERGWVKELRRQATSDVEQHITDDIARARALIEENVDPGAGDHFCLPYTVGSEISIAIMKKLGVKSCSWGVFPKHRHNTVGTDPMRISRIKHDFIWRLPGRGQKSLVRIYAEKLGRRLRGDKVY
jgi:hypothetical protein